MLSGGGARWTKWLEHEFTDRKVRGPNPTSTTRLPLSRLGRPGIIPALVPPSCAMAARHRKSATAGRCSTTSMDVLHARQPLYYEHHLTIVQGSHRQRFKRRSFEDTSLLKMKLNKNGESGLPCRTLLFLSRRVYMGARWPNWLEREFTDRKVRGSNPTSATRLPLSRPGRSGSIPALVLPPGGMAARHRMLQLNDYYYYYYYLHGLRGPKVFGIKWEVNCLLCFQRGAKWSKWLEREFTDRKVRGSNPTSASRLPCLGLGNLAVSQPSCNLWVAWQLGTERVLQLNDAFNEKLSGGCAELQ
ncbi:hypothetical protein T265_10370 [Opisthorchis viverrini]|uniref:Uncharacterized protein n=1 Tax=Opisthorchis viverrini TaxID=6198 RepID=A0A074ZDJ0_OPIVI|nr:hypothetical protein T265_10370 [Opisthorchis viverrini]KER21270.1 hypothetical protein T265_10370 [Opisthorchis viverrini]